MRRPIRMLVARQRGLSAVQTVLLTGTALFIGTGVRQAWKSSLTPFAERTERAVGGRELALDSAHGANPDTDGDEGKKAPPTAQETADATWKANAEAAAKNLENDPDLVKELETAAAGSSVLSLSDLKQVIAIESLADKSTGQNSAGFAGLFQMGQTAADDVGVEFDTIDEASEWKENIKAGVKFLEKNAAGLEKKGHAVTPLTLYLAHQQGLSGADKILDAVADGTAAETKATANQLSNLPASFKNGITESGRDVTVQDFYDYWAAAVGNVQAAIP